MFGDKTKKNQELIVKALLIQNKSSEYTNDVSVTDAINSTYAIKDIEKNVRVVKRKRMLDVEKIFHERIHN